MRDATPGADLSGRELTDESLPTALQDCVPLQEKTCRQLDLSNNRISAEGLDVVASTMADQPDLSVRLYLNSFSFTEMYAKLEAIGQLQLLQSGRLTAENSDQGTLLERQAVKQMTEQGSLEKLTAAFNGYINAEATSIEQEVTMTVFNAFDDAAFLSITELVDGSKQKVEFDGIVVGSWQGKEVLACIEAKHKVKGGHITSPPPAPPGLVQRLTKFKDLLSNLPEGGSYKVKAQHALFSEFRTHRVVGVIGGPHFSESLQAQAVRQGLIPVVLSGNRYRVRTGL